MLSKLRILTVFMLFVFYSSSSIMAQNNPIVIQSVLVPPYPVYYSDVSSLPGLVTVIVQNTDMSNSYTIRFRMKLDGGNGVEIVLPEEVIPSSPITLSPGEVKTLNGDDLSNMYQNLSQDDLMIKGIDEDGLLKSQRIPDGFYKLCLQAFSNDYVKPLSGPEPTGCSNKMQVFTLEPPVVLSPQNDLDIRGTNPQQILMRWTPVNSATAAMLYDIRIAEVPEGVSVYEAMRTDNLLFYEEKDYPATVFSYGPSFPSLVSNKRYAIQITAHDATETANIRNNGKSDIVSFTYLPPYKSIGPSFVCNDPCPSLRPPANQNNIDELQPGDEITIGNFTATITEVSKNGTRFSGKALLSTSSFFAFPIWMTFSNIGVNTDYEVYQGTLKAELRDEMTQMSCYDSDQGFMPTSDEDMADIYDVILDPVDAITVRLGGLADPGVYAGVRLPLGYGDEDKNIAITKMELTPITANMNLITGYTMSGDFRNGEANFVFGVKNVCITPGGPASGNNNSTIALLRDIDYFPNNNYTLRFKSGNIRSRKGCYGEINCEGLQSVHLGGVISFDKESFLPEDGNGNLIPDMALGAEFQAETADPNNWIAQLDFDGSTTLEGVVISQSMRVVGLPDYSFQLQNLYFDCSTNDNPPGAQFPNGYLDGVGNAWQGVYIRNFNMLMPNYFEKDDSLRLSVDGQNFIFDDQGHTFDATGNQLLTPDHPGKMDDWDFTIRSLQLQMLRSNLIYGRMKGRIKIDIADNFIEYDAQMRIVGSQMRYNFDVQTGRELNVDIWGATLALDSTSTVGVQIDNTNIDLEANLTGSISLKEAIGNADGINLKGIKFENLKVSSHPPYLSNATFDLMGNGVQEFGGFKVGIEKVELTTKQDNLEADDLAKKALSFDMDMGFGDEDAGFSAGANIEIIAKKSRQTKKWAYDDMNIGDIELRGEVSSVEVDGVLNWYNNDSIYGNGYRGAVAATFFDDFIVQTEMLFGTVDNYDYWYVDGATQFPTVVPFVGAFGLKGFGGGAYYNMVAKGAYTPIQLGSVSPEPNYKPEKNGWGFKALVVMAAVPEESVFSGTAQVEMGFRGNVISNIGFNGDFAMMQSPQVGSSASNESPMIRMIGKVDYQNTPNQKYLDATLAYAVNIPREPKLLWGEKLEAPSISFHDAGRHNWYLYLGEPANMLGLKLGFQYKLFGNNIGFNVGVNTYFCAGSDLPAPPPFPANAPGNLAEIGMSDPSTGNASGVMMGVHADFDMPRKTAFEIWGNGVYFEAGAGLGFDLAVRRLNGALCNGSSDFGIDKWRADAKGYLFGYAHLNGKILGEKFAIAGGEFSAGMQTIMPNPTYFGAKIHLGVDLPIYGGYNINTSFTTGETCEYEMDDSFMDDIALAQLISEIRLSKDVDSVYAYDKTIHAIAKMNIPIGQVKSYTMADGSILKTKVGFEVAVFKKINDESIENISTLPLRYNTYSNDRFNVKIGGRGRGEEVHVYIKDGFGNALLEPNGSYGIKVKATLMYTFDNGDWKVFMDGDDKPASETKYIRFVTKKSDTKIYHVVSSIPSLNERFFYLGDHQSANDYYLKYSNDSLFDAYGNNINVKVVYTDVYDGEEFMSGATLYKNQNKIVYSMPRGDAVRIDAHTGRSYTTEGDGIGLRRGRVYEVKFYVGARSERDIGKYKEIYKYYCRTSKYDKFMDKLNDLSLSSAKYRNSSSPTQKYITLKFALEEPFSIQEGRHLYFEFDRMFLRNTQIRTTWCKQRGLLEYYAEANKIDYSFLAPEFEVKQLQYKLLGPLTMSDVEDAEMNGYSNDKPINLEVKWNLNSYTYALWVITKIYQQSLEDDNDSQVQREVLPRFDVANIDLNRNPFLGYDASAYRNPPYVTSPSQFTAKLRINHLRIMDIDFYSKNSTTTHIDEKTEVGGNSDGKTGNGKPSGKPGKGDTGNTKPGDKDDDSGKIIGPGK